MLTSRSASASVSLKTGMPVHIETMSAISSSPTSGCSASADSLRHDSSRSRFFCVSLRSLSRRLAAFSNSCLDRRLLVLAHLLDLVLELAVARRRGHRADAQARRSLVDQ